jgi:hypothetical protein
VHLTAESSSPYETPTDAGALRPDGMARTETAPLSINPNFLNNTFILRLPQAVGAMLQPRALLSVQLWSAPESPEVLTALFSTSMFKHVDDVKVHCICLHVLQKCT